MSDFIPPFTDEPTCYILVGAPCSGKTLWRQDHLKTLSNMPVAVISSDDLIEAAAEEAAVTYSTAFAKLNFDMVTDVMMGMFNEAVAQQKTIVVDRPNMTALSRRQFLSKLPDSYKCVAVVFLVNHQELCRRTNERSDYGDKIIPAHRIKEFLLSYQRPLYSEGFDVIHVFSEDPVNVSTEIAVNS